MVCPGKFPILATEQNIASDIVKAVLFEFVETKLVARGVVLVVLDNDVFVRVDIEVESKSAEEEEKESVCEEDVALVEVVQVPRARCLCEEDGEAW